jgi:hypothetical protein
MTIITSVCIIKEWILFSSCGKPESKPKQERVVLATTSQGYYTTQLIQLLMDDLSANTHLQPHESHSSPFLKPTEAP